MVEADGSSTQT